MPPPGNVDVVRDFIDALNEGRVDALIEGVDPDFEWMPLEDSPIAHHYRGREQVRHYVEDWLATFDSLRLELEEVREVGDHVITAVHGHGRGRLSGVELHSSFCQVWSISGGTPTRMREYRNLQQGLASLPA